MFAEKNFPRYVSKVAYAFPVCTPPLVSFPFFRLKTAALDLLPFFESYLASSKFCFGLF